MSISAMKQAYAVPLIEQLESVPADARMMYEHDKFHHQNIPVGRLCHEAATALRQAIAEAEKQEQWSCPHGIEDGACKQCYEDQTKPKMRRTTRKEKIVNPGVYEVPIHAIDISEEHVDKTAKRKHEWVGLTKMELIKLGVFPFGMSYELYEAIEAKLKEKNCG